MSSVNLYDVLNVSNDCTPKELKNAYKELAKKFHPDKTSGDSEMFELITHAYNILINPDTRREYDNLYDLVKQTDNNHFDLRASSKDYIKSQENDYLKKNKSDKDFENEFKRAFEDLDRKHGFIRDDNFVKPLSETATLEKLRDIKLSREQDDIENLQENIFEGKEFNGEVFNALYDATHKTFTEIIKHNGNPIAWDSGNMNITSINNYESIFGDENELEDNINGTLYGSIKKGLSDNKKKIKKEDLDNIKPAFYTKNHNNKKMNGDEFKKEIENYIKETEGYNLRNMQDFEQTLDEYSIFNKLGLDKVNTLTWDDDDDIKTRYRRLLELRVNK